MNDICIAQAVDKRICQQFSGLFEPDVHTALDYFSPNKLILHNISFSKNEKDESDQRFRNLIFGSDVMELKRINDSAQRNQPKPGQQLVENFDTKISSETVEALKQVDANIRAAEQKAGHLLVA